MNDDPMLVKVAIRLVDSGDFSIASWETIIAKMHSGDLLNLITAGRTALEYGIKNKCLKGLPKKSWQHAVEKFKGVNGKQEDDRKAGEAFAQKVEEILKEKGVKIA